MSAPTQPNVPHVGMTEVSPPYIPHPQAAPPAPPKGNRTPYVIAVVALVVLLPVMLCAGIALFAGGVGIFVASHQVEQTAASRYAFTVSDHPTISVLDTAGRVTITSGAVKQVTVSATKRARSTDSQAARQMLDEINVAAIATANGVRVDATTSQGHPLSQQSVDLRITVPRTSDLNVTVTAGTATISRVAGVFRVRNTAGTVDLQDVTVQGTTNVNVSTGTFRFDGVLATEATCAVTVGTGNADIQLPRTSATHLDAHARVGNISVSDWPATIDRSGVGQSTVVDLNQPTTTTLTVRVDVGNIVVGAR